jgi:hypothetical protein
VTTALDARREVVLLRELQRHEDVRHAETAGDECRPPIDHGVPYRTRVFIARIAWEEKGTTKTRFQVIDRFPAQDWHLTSL